jgi:heavy metal sensor kinase
VNRVRPSIRLRLTGWYSTVLCVMLIVYATATYMAVRHEFFEQLEDQLHDDFETAEGFLVPAKDGHIAWAADRDHDSDQDEDRGIEAWTSGGVSIYRSGASASLPNAAFATASAAPRYESLDVNGRSWRTLTQTTHVGTRSVVIRVSRSEEKLRAQMAEIRDVLMLGLPLVVALAGVGGYILARRALTPIDHLADEARRITAERLHERLSVLNPSDEIGRLTVVINDTYARLEASFEQLRRFTADASHELRTPLAVVRGIGEMSLRETRTPTEYTEAIGSILEEVDRLTHLVDTLLRLSYGDAGTVRLSPETIDLAELARDVAASLAVLAEERHQRLDIESSNPVLTTVDRGVLREAIVNVLDNAIKYGPKHSCILIRVREHRDRAILEVDDEGRGIAPEHRERIFDRFFRVDHDRSRESGGTGLGLSIAKWAVEVNGGRIAVERGAAGGALFRIDLPQASAPASAHPPEPAPQRRRGIAV